MKEPALASSSTPALKKARRHSAAIGSQNSAKVLKRTKTNVTYGSSKNTRITEPVPFDALRNEGLPGTLQANFADHEPTVMFRDTGSTIVDNESSQLRMVEQTINQSKQLSNAGDQRLVDSDKPDSSPFPWSTGPTQTPGGVTNKQSSQERQVSQGEIANKVDAGVEMTVESGTMIDAEMELHHDAAEPAPGAIIEETPIDPSVSQKPSPQTHPSEVLAIAGKESHTHSPKAHPPPQSSPQVSVPRVKVKPGTQVSTGSDEVPKGRKRKASTAANPEPLNSDDRAIGHPKEMYQPRLSRRRATGLVEQPQDFSLVPEKAAKRRRKSANTASTAPELAEDELALGTSAAAAPSKAASKSRKMNEPAERSDESANRSTAAPAMIEKPPPDRGEVRALLKDLDFPLTNTSFEAGKTEKPSPTKDASPLSAKKVAAAATVAMPPPASPSLSTSPTKRMSKAAAAFAMPPPSSSAKKTSRRSHTTIFEDHVEFGGSQQKSPSLRQQQADRKAAALKEVKNVSTQPVQRKRRSIVQDDEDEDGEDELVKDHVDEVTVPKKRGRPAKASTQTKPSSTRVLPDSDDEPDDEIIVVEPPKKKGRAAKQSATKPAKSAEKVLEDSEDDFAEHVSEDDEPPRKKAGGRPAKALSTADDAIAATKVTKPSSRRPSSASIPPATPPPEKGTPLVTEQATKAPAETKSGPTAHTPIKTNSKVIHRVGLNRRQRVQPLLKIVRPPVMRPPPPTKKRKDV